MADRSYQYVAMYNVNNKFAHVQGGWNTVSPDYAIKDHTMQEITGYVNIPLASRMGDFKKPEKIPFYSACTEGYCGDPPVGKTDADVFENNLLKVMQFLFSQQVSILTWIR